MFDDPNKTAEDKMTSVMGCVVVLGALILATAVGAVIFIIRLL